jgi:hypothetical protein
LICCKLIPLFDDSRNAFCQHMATIFCRIFMGKLRLQPAQLNQYPK